MVEQSGTRGLAAILAADMVGYSRLGGKWLAFVSGNVVKRFWLLPPSHHLDEMGVGT